MTYYIIHLKKEIKYIEKTFFFISAKISLWIRASQYGVILDDNIEIMSNEYHNTSYACIIYL